MSARLRAPARDWKPITRSGRHRCPQLHEDLIKLDSLGANPDEPPAGRNLNTITAPGIEAKGVSPQPD
jgi:hypothetical protein